MDHMSTQVWEKWKRTALAHMAGQGCHNDYAEALQQVSRRKREANEMLDIIFGCEDMEDLEATFNADIKFCDLAIEHYRANMPNDQVSEGENER